MATTINHDWCKRSVSPPHEVQDKDKLESMIETLRRGHHLPPIVVWCNDPGASSRDGEPALCGSHRIAAYNEAYYRSEQAACSDSHEWDDAVDLDEIPCVYVTDHQMQAVADELGCDLCDVLDSHDYNVLCETMVRVIDDPDVRAALADQV